MTEFQITESVEQLEARHSALKQRIKQAVDSASEGQADSEDLTALTREAAALKSRIETATADRERDEYARRQDERERAAVELVEVRTECLEQRTAFLAHYRSACLSLGSYLQLRTRACELTNATACGFGVLPPERNALHALEFSEPPVDSVRAGLMPQIDAGWKLSFPITPMYDKFQRGDL